MSSHDLFGDDLVSVVAHDLKLPINAVRGFIELIQQAGELNEKQLYFSNRALAGLERMESLIAALLEMAELEHKDQLELADCDLGAVVRSAVDLVTALAEQRQVTLSIEVDDALGVVQGEQRLLGQVLNNLLVNAIKYNHEGGQIWVQVTNQPDFVRVDIRDTGVGVPDEDQPHIFDRFFRAGNSAQTRVAGSGLGLAIVKTIIQKHRGYIWLSSKEGEGSTFSFTLPRKDQPGEGHDLADKNTRSAGEGQDQRDRIEHEVSIEDVDVVDDNTQEARGAKEIDSSSDAV